uniref:Nitric oxide synthase-interacting protein n=1 Tax=Sphenodon punctatus TaxID=8508 RepID=A0A8D0GUE7_SPHPU
MKAWTRAARSGPEIPDGYLYEKEAILEYILHQKKEMARQMKAYEKQKNEKKAELEELTKAAKESKVKGFLEKEMSIVSKPLNPFERRSGSGGLGGQGLRVGTEGQQQTR